MTEDEVRAAAAAAAARANSSVLDEYARAQAIFTEAPELDGGMQGLHWCEENLIADDDGDLAHGFIIADRQPESR